MARCLRDDLLSLRPGEKGVLLQIEGYRDYDLVEDLKSPLDDIQVAVGNGIKGSGIDHSFFHFDS